MIGALKGPGGLKTSKGYGFRRRAINMAKGGGFVNYWWRGPGVFSFPILVVTKNIFVGAPICSKIISPAKKGFFWGVGVFQGN